MAAPGRDDDRVLSAGSDGMARVWSLTSGEQLGATMGDASLRIEGVLWSADGRQVLAGGADGLLRDLDPETGTVQAVSADGHDDEVIDIGGSADGRRVVSLSRDQEVRIWSIDSQVPVDPVLADLGAPLYGLALSPDGASLAVGGDGEVHLLSAAGELLQDVAVPTGPVLGLAYVAPDRVAIGGSDGSIRIREVRDGSPVTDRTGAHDGPITALAWSEDTAQLASVGDDGVIRTWRLDPDELVLLGESPGRAAETDVAFTDDGSVVSSSVDGQVRIWDPARNTEEFLAVDSALDRVSGIAVSRDGDVIAAATATDGVTLWDRASGTQLSRPNGQPTAPLDVAFTADDTAFVSVSREGVVALWSRATGEQLGPRFTSHTEATWRVALWPSGAVLTTSEDGTVRVNDALDIDRACELVGSAFDRGAQQRFLGDREPQGCR